MVRFSHYNIISEPLSNGSFVFINGLTGSVDLFPEKLGRLAQMKQNDILTEADQAVFTPREFQDCLERGYLTERTAEEEIQIVREFITESEQMTEDTCYQVMLATNLGCNYRCTYCFERDNPYFKKNKTLVMTHQQADGAFRFMEQHYTDTEITLFGGEPLCQDTLDIVIYIVNEKNHDGAHHFSAITNGHDLHLFLPLLGHGKIEQLQITVDGPKEIHDKRRVAIDGTSSFDRIMDNLTLVLNKTDADISLRINVDNRNIQYLHRLLTDFQERGFFETPRFRPYAGKVCGLEDGMVTMEEIDRILDELKEEFPGFLVSEETETACHGIREAPLYDDCVSLNGCFCGVTGTTKLFAPDDLVYTCTETVGKQQYAEARYDADGILHPCTEGCNLLRQHLLHQNEQCICCPYVLLCRGGCAMEAIRSGKNYDPRECEFYTKRFSKLMARTAEEMLRSEL